MLMEVPVVRPAEFAVDEIVTAGEELLAAGRNVTGFALRQKVGGGNPNRLKQVWDEHLAARHAKEAEPVAELPVEVAEEVAQVTRSLTDRLASLAVELNDRAVKAAERRVAEVVRTAGTLREQAGRELADASQTVEDLESQLAAARTEVESLAGKLGDAQARIQDQAVEQARLRERLVAAEQSAVIAADGHAQAMASALAELEELRSGSEEARREMTAGRERMIALEEQLKAVHVRQDAVQAEAGALAAQLDQARAQGQELVVERARLCERLAAVEQAALSAAKGHAQAMSQAGDDIDVLRSELVMAKQALVESRELAATLAGKLEVISTQNEALLSAVQLHSGGAQTE